mgnify:CR=1 FL=1
MVWLLNKLNKQTNKLIMKFFLTLFFILSVSFSFGQKKEIKKAIKLFESGDVQGAKDLLDSNSTLFEAAEAKITNQKLYLEGKIFQADKKFQLAYENFKAYTEAGGNDVDYENQLQSLSSDIDFAGDLNSSASMKLHLATILIGKILKKLDDWASKNNSL